MGMGSDDSDVMDLTRNIMMVSVIALFIIVIFLIVLHLYSRWYWSRRRQTALADHRQPRGGLDASFLKIIEFHPKDFEHGVECAICLSELEEGDKARILPKCHHGFHMECIDMWFHSHSTCPICRHHISQQQSNSPTHDDVLMTNDNHHQEEEPSSSSSSSSLQVTGIRPDLVIDIAAAQHNQEEEEQQEVSSSSSSSSTRSSGMRSFKRIFSPGGSSNPKSCPLTP